ncbi:MAG: hypothetical protein E7429_00905 [Ruminococcaceae bacterium]|nr:hypothetical protein [Oscillospiraceae bacterium]
MQRYTKEVTLVQNRFAEQIREFFADLRREEEEFDAQADRIVQFIKEQKYAPSVMFTLVRYVQQELGVTAHKYKGKIVTFTPVDELCGSTIPEEECDAYRDYFRKRMGESSLKEKDLFAKTITKSTYVPTRKRCFEMAFALRMPISRTDELLQAVGENYYSLRSVEELIYYFCQSHKDRYSWEEATRLLEAYEAKASDSKRVVPREKSMDMERSFINVIAENSEEALIDWLLAHQESLCGYSDRAYESYVRLTEELSELCSESADDILKEFWTVNWIRKTRYMETREVKPDDDTKKDPNARFARDSEKREDSFGGDFVGTEYMSISTDVRDDLLFPRRHARLMKREIPVKKRDILFLSVLLWKKKHGDNEMSPVERITAFRQETNERLNAAALPVIYPPARFDRLMLLAVAVDDPDEVTSRFFGALITEEDIIAARGETEEK